MDATLGLTRPFSFGRGWPQLHRLADIEANEPALHLVPGSRTERLVAVHCHLETGAGGVGRFAQVDLLDADGRVWLRAPASGPVPAEEVASVNWALGLTYWHEVVGEVAVGALPDLMLRPGMAVAITVSGGQEGDLLSNISMLVEEFPNGPDGYPTGVYAVPPVLAPQ